MFVTPQLREKEQDMLDERIKRSGKSRPTSAVEPQIQVSKASPEEKSKRALQSK